MGRTIGEKRPRRKQAHRTLPNQQDQSSWHATNPATPQLLPNSGQWTPPELSPHCDENWPHFTKECDIQVIFPEFTSETLSHLSFTDDSNTQSNPIIESAPINPELPELHCLTPETSSPLDLDIYIPPHHVPDSNTSSMTPPLDPVTFTPVSTPEVQDSTTIWTQQLSILSQKLVQSPCLLIDEVLTTNSTLVGSISSCLNQLPADPGIRISVLHLIPVCMAQVLSLFEQCIVHSSHQNQDTPRLQLGSYQIDLESQRILQGPIIRKELMQLVDAVQKIKALLPQQGKPETGVLSHLETCDLLLNDVLRRVKGLGERLKEP